ncbi:MAG: molybdate ABC transporter substrate-binding protein [Phycisphaerales bacterium]
MIRRWRFSSCGRTIACAAALTIAFAGTTLVGACRRSPPPLPPPTVLRVAADGSIADALREAASAFTRHLPNVSVEVVGASGAELVERIRGGEAFDAVLLADPRWIGALQADGLVEPETPRPVAGNTLVLAIPSSSEVFLRSPHDLLDSRLQRIAMGDPDREAVGGYARRVLESAGLWDAVRPRAVLFQSSAETLDAAKQGKVDGAFVFGSQMITELNGDVRIGLPWSLPETIYYTAPLRATKHPATTSSLVDFLAGEEFRNTLFHHGFQVDLG